MSNRDNGPVPTWGIFAISWTVSFYFLFGFVANLGFPPDRKILLGDALFVGLWLLFLLLPFFQKIKIGKLLELEREIGKTNSDLEAFRSEVRNTLSVLSTNVNTIGGMSNQVTVNLPGLAELRDARENVSKKATPAAKKRAESAKEILLNDEDMTLALARTRIEIERLLRGLVNKKTHSDPLENDELRFLSVPRLLDMYISRNEEMSFLREPVSQVLKVCNAAIHAQVVPVDKAHEALTIGAEIIGILARSER